MVTILMEKANVFPPAACLKPHIFPLSNCNCIASNSYLNIFYLFPTILDTGIVNLKLSHKETFTENLKHNSTMVEEDFQNDASWMGKNAKS